MPLARIITRVTENADILAEDLRARGFEVQTRSPQETFAEPADLEITLEECAIEDALAGAAHAPISQDVWVFIAPGAVSENLRPFRVASLIPEAVAAKPVIETKAEPALQTALAEASALPVLAPAATAIRDLEVQREPAEDVRAMTYQAEAAVPHESEAKSAPVEAEIASAESIVSTGSEVETHLEVAEVEAVAALQEVASEPEPVITPGPEPVSHGPVGEPVAAERQVPEQPRPIVFETEVATARASTPDEAQLQSVSQVSLASASHRARSLFPTYRVRLPRMSRKDKLLRRTAPLAAMLALAFLLLAASSHRFAPVPAGLAPDSGEIRQPVPFANGKSGTPIPAQIKTAVTAAPAAQNLASPAVKPTAAKPLASNLLASSSDQAGTANHKVSLAASRERVIAPKPRRHAASSSDADYVAKDTVVRYGARSAGSATVPRK